MSRKRAPVVITRKDKRLRKGLHLFAFALTGGMSAPVTAAKAGTNAAYNARTRKLAAGADAGAQGAQFRRDHVPASSEYKQAHGGG
jgi:hypothetical protein